MKSCKERELGGESAVKKRRNKRHSVGILKTLMYGRTLLIALSFLLQLLLLMLGYAILRNYSFGFYCFFSVVGAVAVLHIFNTRGNTDMKLSWMFLIAIMPIFGAVLYVTITMQPGMKVRYKKLQELSEKTREYVEFDERVWTMLRGENPQMGQLSHYLYTRDGSPVYRGTQVTYFSLGEEQFEAMQRELEKAKKFIFMEFFIVSEGCMWDALHEILKRKAAEGVEVRFMYDGTDVLYNLPSVYPRILEREGIRCKVFAPIKPIFSPHYNNRDHRKILVIDGKVAFTGGINIADEYINEKLKYGHWKDVGVMLRGAAAERFTYMFLELWNESEKVQEQYGLYKTPKDAREEDDGYLMPYSVMPLGVERVGERVYMDIINTAHTYIHIMTPYLILDYQMLKALCYAAKRGVEVIVIMPHIPDKKYVFVLGRTYYNELLDAGVKIYEYEPGFVHAKVFVSDDVKAVVGTVNLDYRSLYHHFECGILLYRNSQIEIIEQDVQETLKKCIAVTPETYEEMKFTDRFVGGLLRIVAPLM